MFSRIWYEIRWWHWFLFAGSWPWRTLYSSPWHLDRHSRRLIIDRIEKEKDAQEPQYRGTYPHRRDHA